MEAQQCTCEQRTESKKEKNLAGGIQNSVCFVLCGRGLSCRFSLQFVPRRSERGCYLCHGYCVLHTLDKSNILAFPFLGQGSPHYHRYISSLQSKGSVLSGKSVIVSKLTGRRLFPRPYILSATIIGQVNRNSKASLNVRACVRAHVNAYVRLAGGACVLVYERACVRRYVRVCVRTCLYECFFRGKESI